MSILTNIRKMSEGGKKIFSLIGAVVLTLLIIYIWFPWQVDDSQVEENKKLSSVSPLNVIKDELLSFKKIISGADEKLSEPLGLVDNLGEMEEILESVESNIPIEIINISSTTDNSTTTNNTN